MLQPPLGYRRRADGAERPVFLVALVGGHLSTLISTYATTHNAMTIVAIAVNQIANMPLFNRDAARVNRGIGPKE